MRAVRATRPSAQSPGAVAETLQPPYRGAGMRFCVLGPLEVYEGERVAIGGGRERALLALLLVHEGEVVSRDRLIDELWHGRPPPGAAQSLDTYVSRIRRAMRAAGGDGAIVTRTPGYLLEGIETDVAQFEATVRVGR